MTVWAVYGLEDPRNREIFYVGFSRDVIERAKQHRWTSDGAPWGRIREILAAGFDFTIKILKEFDTEKKARKHEARLIATLPNLTNRDVLRRRRGLGLIPASRPIILMLPRSLADRIDAEWHKRKLGSRSETIRVLLAEALR